MSSILIGNRAVRNIILMVAITVAGCKEPGKEKQTHALKEKNAVSKPVLTDLNGQSIDLDRYKGRTVFINFWATWCKPCIQELPSIGAAQDILSKDGIVFLLATSESVDQINEFKKDQHYDFSYVRLVNMEELNLAALPTTYIYNPRGELAFSEIGYRQWDDSVNIEMIQKINNQK